MARQRHRDAQRHFGIEILESRHLLAGDLAAHWRAFDLSNVTNDQAPVLEWTDRQQAIAATAGGSPTFDRTAFGGRGGIRFDAADGKDWFSIHRSVNPLSRAESFSVAVVVATTYEQFFPVSSNWFEGTGIVHSNRLGLGKDWGITVSDNGTVYAGIGGGLGGPSTTVSSDRTITDGLRHTILFTHQNGTLQLYLDDSPPVSVAGQDTGSRDRLNLQFGQSLDQQPSFDGAIGEVRIYDGALTEAEAKEELADIATFYNNSPPNAAADSYALDEDTILFVSKQQGVLANDVDPDGDALSVELVQDAQHGTLVLNADGSFLYDPDPDFFGVDTFHYQAVDFRGSEPVQVVIDVRPKYDPPIGQVDEYFGTPGTVLNIPSLIGVLANDTNIDRTPWAAVVDSPPAFGSLQLAPDGGFQFDPLDMTGRTSFTYRIDDGQSTSEPIEVRLIVNTPPDPAPDRFTTQEDQLLLATDDGVLHNDRDLENDALLVRLVKDVDHGSLNLADDGTFVYQPQSDFFGLDTFTYLVSDGVDETGPVEVLLVVEPLNDPPVAAPDVYFVSGGSSLVVAAQDGVLSNDQDIESTALVANLSVPPQHGTIDFQADGSFTYHPSADFSGTDRFEYIVIDEDGAQSTALAKLFVNEAPVVISELMAANGSFLLTRTRLEPDDRFRGERESPDWVELFNRTDTPFDLSGFQLTDSLQSAPAWSFPRDTTIAAGGYLVLFLDGQEINDPALDENGYLHAPLKLDARGDFLALLSPSGDVVDALEEPFPTQVADVSFARTANGFRYATTPTPGEANGIDGLQGITRPAEASVPAGYYSDAFSVQLTSPEPDGRIRYTLDGSTPTEENGIDYTGPISISKTTLLRTRVFRPNFLPSSSRTHSYLFLDEVLTQPAAPEGFPETWGRAGRADYEVDPRIATDMDSEFYDPNLRAALQTHDAISIVTDMPHLFDRTSGIYANPQQQGVAWERPASMEVISADGTLEFQINAGLRIQGGASRNPNRPKHNMRFLFKEQYGDSELVFPFFEDSPIQEFDTLIMRGGNGDSWFHPNSTQQRQAQYIRDQWHKRTQKLMGHTFVPQRYMHLYLNGLYWGLYHVFEKPTASFFAKRFGGEPEEYDVIQHQQGVVDGTRDTWNQVVQLARQEADAPETLEMIQKEVAFPDFMEYLLLNFYSGNVDWDQNNWFGGRKREGGKFRFFTWDAERTFLSVSDNRVNASNTGQPTDVHRRLARANPEYRMMFADAAHRLLFNDGLLTPESAAARWQGLADEIELALTAESARWGDNKRPRRPYTPDNEWKDELNRLMTSYFPRRTEILLTQLRRANLYPDVAAPSFNQHGGEFGERFELSIDAPDGTIYYTLDGQDPRRPGGGISEFAQVYSGQPITLTDDTTVRARAWVNGEWSALNEATFLTTTVVASADNLRISEIHFNPSPPTSAEIAAGFDNNDDFEFMEFVNVGTSAIDLSNVRLQTTDNGGVDFDFRFSAIQRLRPGERLVVVENTEAFALRYGDNAPVAGAWSGRLSNSGETITVIGSNGTIQEFAYDDAWYPQTDGGGHSLEVINLTLEPEQWFDRETWRASQVLGGTPGWDGSIPIVLGDSNHDGIFDSSDLVFVFQAGEFEDDIDNNSTFEEGDWNGDGDFTTRDFVVAFQAGTYVRELKPIFVDADSVQDRIFNKTPKHQTLDDVLQDWPEVDFI